MCRLALQLLGIFSNVLSRPRHVLQRPRHACNVLWKLGGTLLPWLHSLQGSKWGGFSSMWNSQDLAKACRGRPRTLQACLGRCKACQGRPRMLPSILRSCKASLHILGSHNIYIYIYIDTHTHTIQYAILILLLHYSQINKKI